MAEPIVLAEKIDKVYTRGAEKVHVLSQLSLKVEPGEFLALMGPSGSGKSTLLNLIGGIDTPTSGRLVIAGTDISQKDEQELALWRRHHIGFIFQLYFLVPVLTAFENVELPLLLFKMSKADRRKRVEIALKIVGLAERMNHYPNQLSGGQEQRVAIARAFVTDPNIILADEPTGDLDAVSETEIMKLLAALNKEFGKTIVMVTHDPRAAGYAHRVLHLDKGLLVHSTLKEELKS